MSAGEKTSSAYRRAGVDTGAGQTFVRRIAPLAASTRRAGAEPSLGGFGGLFDLAAAGWKDPILAAATDGAGTKTSLAIKGGRPEVAGCDLVAMCVNDLAAQGAEPLFFLDYIAAGKLEIEIAARLVEGIAGACKDSGCALIGGETAEMPGTYRKGEHDLAGFAVGALERGEALPRGKFAEGDVILGLESDGLHANGFSLIRKILQKNKISLTSLYPHGDKSLGDVLLVPTRLYVKPVLQVLRGEYGQQVKGAAHITGGGWEENLPRGWGNTKEWAAELDANALPLPDLFQWLGETGNLTLEEMRLVFNCGLGMAVIVAESAADSIASQFAETGERVVRLGHLVKREAPNAPALRFSD